MKFYNIPENLPLKLYPTMISSNCVPKEFKSKISLISRMMRNKKTKKNWNEHDVDILVWVLNKYTTTFAKKSVHILVNFIIIKDDEDWKFISSLIPATSPKRCMFKWLSLKKFSLMAFKWSKEESTLL